MKRSRGRCVTAISVIVFSVLIVSALAVSPNHPIQRTQPVSGTIDQYLLFENSDFEMGDLTNWTAAGNAFDFQPTNGDNPTARNRRQPSKHQGQYWIGTFEKFQGKDGQRPGQVQGDKPTGTLTSAPFEILGDKIIFIIGGGKDPQKVYTALVVEGREVLRATGKGNETMTRVVWNVSAHKGKTAKIVINDNASTGWAHINADNFRYDKPVRAAVALETGERTDAVPGLLFENSDFEMGDLTNWTAAGNAFAFQPTRGDNPTARNRRQPSRHQGQHWIGTFEKFQGKPGQRPGQVQGDKPTGTLTSIPFTVISNRITFLIGGGKFKNGCCVALLVDGREVLKSTGNGSESMQPQAWDVSPYNGKTARIIIRDMQQTGWGHLNVDYFRFE